MENAATNTEVQISIQSPDSNAFGYIPRSEIAKSFDTLIQDLQILTKELTKRWAIAPHTLQDPSALVKFLNIIWEVKGCSILGTFKKQLFTLSVLMTLKQAQNLLGLCGFWKRCVMSLQILLKPISAVTHKSAHFECGPFQETALESVSKLQHNRHSY